MPVVHLIQPTAENTAAISADLSQNLYENANFLTSAPRPLLEDFAALAAQNGTANKIRVTQAYDQYLSFLVSELDLFSLHLKDTYYALNSAQAANSAIESTINRVVGGLFCVAATMG